MKYDFNVSTLFLAANVKAGTETRVHQNRTSHGLVLHCNGEKKYMFDNGKSYCMKKNDMLYISKGSNYVVDVLEPGDCYCINFDIADDVCFDTFSIAPKNIAHFYDNFKAAENVWKTKKQGFKMKCKSHLYDIIYHIQQEYQLKYFSKRQSDLILPAIEYIHNTYTTKTVSISELAEICGISISYFRTIFNSIYGISPIKYINKLKLSRAEELIKSGIYTIHEAAELSGFNDVCYFSREFKKAYGYSPRNINK